MSTINSFAQNREDVYVNWLLGGQEKGFYVDVGANDPVVDSVTKYFYDNGWHGINIEPIARLHQALEAARPRDTNIQVGVSTKEGSMLFTEYEGADGLSTLSDAYRKQNKQLQKQAKEYKIPVTSLQKIFTEYLPKGQVIDFLKVDVEGYEYDVIASNDWERYRPRLIVIEANHVNHDWRPLLKEAHYIKVFFDGVNEYYAPDDFDVERALKTYPDMVIGPLILDPMARDYAAWREQVVTEEQAKVHAASLSAYEAKIQSLNREIETLNNRGLRFFVSQALHGLHARIRRKLIWLQTNHKVRATGGVPTSDPYPRRSAEYDTLAKLKTEDVRSFVPAIEAKSSGPTFRKLVFSTLLGIYDGVTHLLIRVMRVMKRVVG